MTGVTRLAPSPTGALHLGNARTFLINWLLARQQGWRIILRIEDLDGPRVKRGADVQAIEDLRWLGIDWDEGPIYQSARKANYDAAIGELLDRKLAYPCVCTRREAALAASAPHVEGVSRRLRMRAGRLGASRPSGLNLPPRQSNLKTPFAGVCDAKIQRRNWAISSLPNPTGQPHINSRLSSTMQRWE
jgi:hypothetical protein